MLRELQSSLVLERARFIVGSVVRLGIHLDSSADSDDKRFCIRCGINKVQIQEKPSNVTLKIKIYNSIKGKNSKKKSKVFFESSVSFTFVRLDAQIFSPKTFPFSKFLKRFFFINFLFFLPIRIHRRILLVLPTLLPHFLCYFCFSWWIPSSCSSLILLRFFWIQLCPYLNLVLHSCSEFCLFCRHP